MTEILTTAQIVVKGLYVSHTFTPQRPIISKHCLKLAITKGVTLIVKLFVYIGDLVLIIKTPKALGFEKRPQSSTSLMADLHQDIKIVS